MELKDVMKNDKRIETILKSVRIYPKHLKFIKQNNLSLGKICRLAIDNLIKNNLKTDTNQNELNSKKPKQDGLV